MVDTRSSVISEPFFSPKETISHSIVVVVRRDPECLPLITSVAQCYS